MVGTCIEEIEQKIRNQAIRNSIRTKEYFVDFDRLRYGYVTCSQFFRIICQNFGLTFTTEEEGMLIEKYRCAQNGMFNYKYFCEEIDGVFDPNKFSIDPACQLPSHRKICSPIWNFGLEEKLFEILKKLSDYYERRGVTIKTLCNDFDERNEGLISETQFYRSIIHPLNFSEKEIMILSQKYQDQKFPGMIRYMEMENDMKRLEKCPSDNRNGHRNILCCKTEELNCKDLKSIMDELCRVVYKARVRSVEFFKDYDPLRSGLITVTQFLAGLDACLGKEVDLSEEVKCIIFRGFEVEDKRICYRDFCNILDSAFMEPNLEKTPTKDVFVPPPEAFGRRMNDLAVEDEEKLSIVIKKIQKDMDVYRVPIETFFKNFETSKNSRLVTKTQFRRVLSQCQINIHPSDFELLCKKFAYPVPDYINIPASMELVDPCKIVRILKQRNSEKNAKNILSADFNNNCNNNNGITGNTNRKEPIDVGCLMDKLRNHIILMSIRTNDYFLDFDPLRSGRISKTQFHRVLAFMGLSSIRLGLNFDLDEMNALSDHYESKVDCNAVDYRQFVYDLEKGYADKHLDKAPSLRMIPYSDLLCKKSGTIERESFSEEQKLRHDRAMCKIASKIYSRNIDLLQIFRNFDKLRHGHLNRFKFRQALGIADLFCPDELDMTAMEAAFYDDEGVNYVAFLQSLYELKHQADVNEANKVLYYEKIREKQKFVSENECCTDKNIASDFQALMLTLKTKLAKQNLRVKDWFKDYDKLNTGYVTKSNFRRSLDQFRFEIKELESCLLEDHYKCPSDPNKINYVDFSNELESIFACPNLEKTPTKECEPFSVPGRCDLVTLTEEEEQLLACCLQKLLNMQTNTPKTNCPPTQYKAIHPSFYPFLRDFDKVNVGAVSKTQFRRALDELGLGSEINNEAAWNVIFKKFAIPIGSREDVDYFTFGIWLDRAYKEKSTSTSKVDD
ncbi:hypothetical protein HELRODRAFT_175512 [Helobdella robusta]|uniref:EF-hand calcium-binding domain-containing protein 6 n=1 Tax=Helobdella robusta TaxID=6412 RepID=T1F9C5_HELRO|nr:hypothetical protein HELRODRAFT_175512 [Helobdella robusta]ESO00551.1 hypothetical protein HELRODRAFT_175512 [Helobdella robusta]